MSCCWTNLTLWASTILLWSAWAIYRVDLWTYSVFLSGHLPLVCLRDLSLDPCCLFSMSVICLNQYQAVLLRTPCLRTTVFLLTPAAVLLLPTALPRHVASFRRTPPMFSPGLRNGTLCSMPNVFSHRHQPPFSPVLLSLYYSSWSTYILGHNCSLPLHYFFIHPAHVESIFFVLVERLVFPNSFSFVVISVFLCFFFLFLYTALLGPCLEYSSVWDSCSARDAHSLKKVQLSLARSAAALHLPCSALYRNRLYCRFSASPLFLGSGAPSWSSSGSLSLVLVLLPSVNFPLSALAALTICVTLFLEGFPRALVLLIHLLFCLLVAFFGTVCQFPSLLVLLCLLLRLLLTQILMITSFLGLPPWTSSFFSSCLLCITIFSPFFLLFLIYFFDRSGSVSKTIAWQQAKKGPNQVPEQKSKRSFLFFGGGGGGGLCHCFVDNDTHQRKHQHTCAYFVLFTHCLLMHFHTHPVSDQLLCVCGIFSVLQGFCSEIKNMNVKLYCSCNLARECKLMVSWLGFS